MSKLDYYKILGIDKNSTDKEIKTAYKKLAIKFHPDKNLGDKNCELKFKEIKEAYETLIDHKKRNLYDKYGHSAFEENQESYDQNFSYNFNSGFGDIFGDIFGDFFNNKNKNNKKKENIFYSLEITFEESIKGVEKSIKVLINDTCFVCNGKGSKDGSFPITCPTCKGSGKMQIKQGFFIIQQICSNCNGNKKIIKNPCKKCNGSGECEVEKILNIKIPSGINNGDQINLSKFNLDNIYIKIFVKNHSIFKREKDDLYCDVPINFSIASLGGEICIPTFDGKIKIKIPKETQSGKLLKIKGKGVYNHRNYNQGDLICKIIVETPINLNDYQKKLIYEFGKSLSDSQNISSNNYKFKSFIDSIKKFF
ncbi:chaperone protein DnaJ [endosymbiont of Euscepes postfasciatus]|uniref:molecular chaperone DnaJ n=1 Tax=endosymbiont of Euscepes postfasciatus TaxID=650377 RepID=UPI000DC6E1E6|nr:molecular chaperone DnaJ [endosymbiont of Euscepes postfasciatus]BBA84710.1 chaperone protein DnaJ [endosymbiont of Euscepes postfasciatus]